MRAALFPEQLVDITTKMSDMVDMPTNSDCLEMFGSIRRALLQVTGPYLEGLGIGPKQLVVLRYIGSRGECSPSEIVADTNSDKGSVSLILSSLSKTKWIQKTSDVQDKRKSVVKLSPKGKRHLKDLEVSYGKVADAFVSGLTLKEREAFYRLCSKMYDGLKESLSNGTRTKS